MATTDTHLAAPTALGIVRRSEPSQRAQPREPSVGAWVSSSSSTDSLAAQPASSANPSPAHGPGGLLSKNNHVSDVLSRAREKTGETWDDDFAADITLSRFGRESRFNRPPR